MREVNRKGGGKREGGEGQGQKSEYGKAEVQLLKRNRNEKEIGREANNGAEKQNNTDPTRRETRMIKSKRKNVNKKREGQFEFLCQCSHSRR